MCQHSHGFQPAASSILKNVFIMLKKWATPPRSLRITKAGWKFIGLTLVVGFAAVNTGNNLLYLVFGLMLSSIAASGILSELMLRKIRITRTFPRHIFARQMVPVSVDVNNHKRRIASFSLLIEDFSQENHQEQTRYILKIPPKDTATMTYPVTFLQRGLHRPGKIRISTRYPFGFFRKSATFVETEDEILVYPNLEKLNPSDIPRLISQAGEPNTLKRGSGLEIHSIREYVHGDGSARIHWKSTAKLAKLMTKEFEEEQKKKISIILDISVPSRSVSAAFYQNVEQAISLTASYIMHFTRNDFQVQLHTPTQKSPFANGQRHLFRLLRVLALLQPGNGHSRQHLMKSLNALNRADVMRILVSVNKPNDSAQGNFVKVIHVNSAR